MTGKSLLASHVAYQAQSAFRHGAVMVNAGHCADASALCQALGLALAHPVGQAAATPAALHAALGGKDLLILVDDLTAQPGLVEVLQQLSLRHAELKWLVTTRLPLALRCERTLRVDPALLLEAEDRGAPTPAAQILAARLPRIAPTVGASAWAVLEQLARLCDGLPRALELAADRLDTMAPTELVERLHADPAALLRQPGAGGDARRRLARDVDDWLAAATPRELTIR